MELFGRELVERLVAAMDDSEAAPIYQRRVDVEAYQSDERFREEQAMFRSHPVIVAHATAVAKVGDCLPTIVAGLPIVVVRGSDDKLRAFLNACRHRSTQLLSGTQVECKKAFVCPYHGWTYDLAGELIHIPHAESFRNVERADYGLVELPVAERHGLVWVLATPGAELEADLGLAGLADAIAQLDLSNHVVFRRAHEVRMANWKFVVEAFLENYHIRQLHRHSVYPFFLDGVVVNDWSGPHMRAAVARRALQDHRDTDYDDLEVRQVLTANLLAFPNTIMIVHPTYVSRLTIDPVAVDQFGWTHEMMIPAEQDIESRRGHFEKSWALIEGGVFQQEDLVIVEQIQAGLATGANRELVFGGYEEAAGIFHDHLEAALVR